MALTTHPIYGDTEQLYNILSTSGLFTSVTKSIVDSTKTITCSDLTGTRLVVKVSGVEPDGSGGTNMGYTYYYGGDKYFYCMDYDGHDYELKEWRFPYIVYQTTSTLVIVCTGRTNSTPTWPLPFVVFTKDNNGYVGVLCSNNYDGIWDNACPYTVSKDASAPIYYYSPKFATIGSATTLVPAVTNDASKVTYFPKVFRGVSTQYRTDQVGLATLNDNEYLSLFGGAFVRID